MWLVNILQGGGGSSVAGWIGTIVGGAFWLWMLIDAIRREEYVWACFIFFFTLFSAVLYFFLVYRQAAPTSVRGFELPGAKERKRIKELQAQIHHLDKAHHHSQLGDVYFQQGKLDKAEASYRAALERDVEDPETRSHFGQCLLRQGKATEALGWLEGICRQDPKHEYGYSLMAYAEALSAVGRMDEAVGVWRQINEQHSYTRARVQLAELLIGRGEKTEAKALLDEVLTEDPHTPDFQRKRDKVWVRRAKALMKQADRVVPSTDAPAGNSKSGT